MLLPPGTILHKDLNTSFTNFEELLLNLKENRFSGYLHLNFWGYEGILVLDNGKIIQGSSVEERSLQLGEQGIQKILQKAREKDGTIDVHQLSNEVAIGLAAVLGATLFLEEKNVIGGKLPGIFAEMEEAGFTGYLDIEFSNKRGTATVYLLEGVTVEAVIMSNTGKLVSGEIVYAKIIEISEMITSSVKIYRSNRIENVQEDQLFIFPHSSSPRLLFWNKVIELLRHEFARVAKKIDFDSLFQISKAEVGHHFPCFDAIDVGFVLDKQEGLRIRKIIPVKDFEEGLKQCFSLMLEKVSPRKRKKMNQEWIATQLKKFVQDTQEKLPEPEQVIAKIFQGVSS